MSTLTWSDDLVLDQGRMDSTHREFVERLASVERALDEDHESVAEHFDAFLAHTVEHFGQEERWMAQLGFSSENCHVFQHRHVLDVLREVRGVIGTTGDAQILRRLVTELADWFPAHARMMDLALAETMATVGMPDDSQTAPQATAHPTR